MTSNKFYIFLDNPTACYLPGDILSGQVVLKTNNTQVTKGLLLKINGNVIVHWTESETTSNNGSRSTHGTVTYRDAQIIILLTTILLGDGQSKITLPPGQTSYPFRFQLPFTNLPCSYSGDYGRVEYTLSAKLFREGWLSTNYKDKRNIVIAPFLDLNLHPTAPQAVKWNSSKTGFFSGSSYLTMEVSLGAHGYCQGEEVRMLVKFTDKKSKNVKNVAVELEEVVTFRVRHRTNHQVKRLLWTNLKKIENECEEIWEGAFLLPVNLYVTQFGGGCNIIDLQYILKVKADTGIFSSMKMDCPVIIGTVPLQRPGIHAVQQSIASNEFMASAPQRMAYSSLYDEPLQKST